MAELPGEDPGVPQPGENDVDFPYAPPGWSEGEARRRAQAAGLALTDDHWRVVNAVQHHFATHGAGEHTAPRIRAMLDERFRAEGGLQYLQRLFPRDPVAEGCALAGVEPTGEPSGPGA